MEHEEELRLLRESAARLIPWYRAVRRPLPWRDEPTPYRVWISEIMLQQTRIEAVIPYYTRFLQELPDAAALAAVSEDRLLKLWEGLGYYSRARNLKKAAERVVTEFGGALPRTAAALRSLPGIGDYTAGAIASIACGDDVLSQKTKSRVTENLRAVYPSGEEAALLTEGLMELGETLCLPNGEPKCADCPLRSLCLAHRAGKAGDFPVRSPKKERRAEDKTVLLLSCYALRRRPETGLLAGLWEFPNLPGKLDAQAVRAALAAQGLAVGEIRPCGEAKHVFTHVEWHMTGYIADIFAESGEYVWKTPAEIGAEHALPTAFKAYRQLIVDR